jgi:phage-related protein
LERIRLNADELGLKKVAIKVNIDDGEAKAKLAELTGGAFFADAGSSLGALMEPVAQGVEKGVVQGGSDGASKLPGILGSAMDNPEIAGGLTAAIGAALPFLGQLVSGGIVAGFGAGIAGMAIAGASKTKEVQDSFASLKSHASSDLKAIGTSFVPVMNGLLFTAQGTLSKMTPVFAGAAKTMSKAFGSFGSSLISAFSSPAVQKSINAVAKSFSGILTAVGPTLLGNVSKLAGAITNVANAVGKNPKALANFVSVITEIGVFALDTLADLTKVANWVEGNWNKIGPILVGPFLSATKPIFDALGKVITFIKGVPGKIKSAFGNPGSILSGIGRAIMGGLINGLESMLGPLIDALAHITSLFPKHKGPMDVDRVLLRPAGQAIMGGLISGLNDGIPGLTAQLARTTNVISSSPAAVAAGSAASGAGKLQIEWTGDSGGDDFIAYIRKNIRVTTGGDVQKWATGR